MKISYLLALDLNQWTKWENNQQNQASKFKTRVSRHQLRICIAPENYKKPQMKNHWID